MDLILYISELETSNVNIYFVRQHERYSDKQERNDVLIGFYSPREGIPSKIGDNHFRFQIFGHSLINNIIALLDVLNYELEDKQITVHFGWPMSSWWDRFFIGVMVFNLTRLPKMFPKFNFQLNYISVK